MKIKFIGHRPRQLAVGRVDRLMHPGDEFDASEFLAPMLLDQPRWFAPADDEARQLLEQRTKPADDQSGVTA